MNGVLKSVRNSLKCRKKVLGNIGHYSFEIPYSMFEPAPGGLTSRDSGINLVRSGLNAEESSGKTLFLQSTVFFLSIILV